MESIRVPLKGKICTYITSGKQIPGIEHGAHLLEREGGTLEKGETMGVVCPYGGSTILLSRDKQVNTGTTVECPGCATSPTVNGKQLPRYDSFVASVTVPDRLP